MYDILRLRGNGGGEEGLYRPLVLWFASNKTLVVSFGNNLVTR
jgi:hypothetical protein